MRALALDVLGLEALLTGDNVEDNLFALVQGFVTSSEDGGVMYEDVLAAVLNDEAEPVLVIEPLNFATGHSFALPSV